ncbi:hypothetical protein QLX08_009130, partial [Tetragonisca angustula]
MAVLVALH